MEDPEGQSCQEGPGAEVAGYWPHLGGGAGRGRGWEREGAVKEGHGRLSRGMYSGVVEQDRGS